MLREEAALFGGEIVGVWHCPEGMLCKKVDVRVCEKVSQRLRMYAHKVVQSCVECFSAYRFEIRYLRYIVYVVFFMFFVLFLLQLHR